MNPTLTQTKTSTKTVAVAVVMIAVGLGLIGYAAGLTPGIKSQTTPTDLSGTVTASVTTISTVGDALIYTIKIKNAGSAVVKDVSFKESFAKGVLTYVTSSATGGFTCAVVSSDLSCTGGAISAKGTATITMETVLAGNPTACGKTATMSSSLTIDPSNTITESSESNNTASVSLPVPGMCTDLSITKSASVSSATTDELVSYTLAVTNNGSATQLNVKVSDTLSSTKFVYRSATGSDGFSCTQSGLTITCTGGTITSGSTAMIVIIGSVGNNTLACGESESLTDSGKVDPDNLVTESDETNNTATVVTTVTGPCGGTVTPPTTTSGGGGVTGGSSGSGSSGYSPVDR